MKEERIEMKNNIKLLKKHKKKIYIILSLLMITIYLTALILLPDNYAYCYYNQHPAEQIISVIQNIRGTIISVGTGILAIIGIYLTWKRTNSIEKQNSLSETKIKNEQTKDIDTILLQQYSKATELLANEESITARLSGIYLFEKIMNEHENYYQQIIELLTAYVREKRQIDWVIDKEKNIKNTNVANTPVTKDIQAIITVLGRRNTEHKSEYHNNKHLDLSNTMLYQANFSNLNLSNFNFSNSILTNCECLKTEFNHAHFENAYFNNSLCICVNFIGASCSSTIFNNTNLSGVNFERAILDKVSFENTILSDINFDTSICLTATSLMKAKILDAIYTEDDKLKDEIKRNNKWKDKDIFLEFEPNENDNQD